MKENNKSKKIGKVYLKREAYLESKLNVYDTALTAQKRHIFKQIFSWENK